MNTDSFTSFDRVVFTSDLLKVDDRLTNKGPNPQNINIDWIYELFSDFIRNATGLPVAKYVADEHTRVSWYHRIGEKFSSAAWARHYNATYPEPIAEDIVGALSGSLVIGFEMPGGMTKILDRAGIKYIDLSIHPIRFARDYFFGCRSNDPTLAERIGGMQVDQHYIDGFVRISKARSSRVYRNRKLEPGSAVFLGQIEIDSSLIENGAIADARTTEYALLSLSAEYGKVYYKYHPHRKERREIETALKKIPNCEVIEVNIYDLLWAPEVFCFASLSSGSLHEARAFARATKRFISSTEDPYCHEEYAHGPTYLPVKGSVFSESFWHRLLVDGNAALDEPDYVDGAFRFSINQKWGR